MEIKLYNMLLNWGNGVYCSKIYVLAENEKAALEKLTNRLELDSHHLNYLMKIEVSKEDNVCFCRLMEITTIGNDVFVI